MMMIMMMMMTTTTMTTMTIWWYVYINATCFEVHPFFLAPYFWCPDPVRRAKLFTGTYSARISRLATLQDTDSFQHSIWGYPPVSSSMGTIPPGIGGFNIFNGTIIELNERLWEMFHCNVWLPEGTACSSVINKPCLSKRGRLIQSRRGMIIIYHLAQNKGSFKTKCGPFKKYIPHKPQPETAKKWEKEIYITLVLLLPVI